MSATPELPLTGLIGSRPIAALAAFGLLRWSAGIPALRGARLHWELEDDWIAVLTPPAPLAADDLCRLLLDAHATGAGWPHLAGAPTLRMPVADFRARCRADVSAAGVDDRLAADFDAACGCDAIADTQGRLTPTRLHMTSGQQQFVALLRELAASLLADGRRKGRQTPAALLDAAREALFGPWTYPDAEHALGWDPDAERLHALRPLAPTVDNANKSVRFAVWLAHWALPLLPSLPRGRRLQTTAFVPELRGAARRFRWPLWTAPLGVDGVAALLATPELVGDGAAIARLQARGVSAVFESLRHEFGQGYAVFRPARLVPPGEGERRPLPAAALVF
ncbi:hypothetical protein EV699_1223 [Plasticicumulans lactativorans]|uniref:CRISPR-associated protein Csb3 n=1 Tax=Plasticicumulans lactativorans TaxID=1133106 RepID=A0A4R2LHN9_9GAMM|nr:hypothetical protein [Plasticicumulans lactativorans]TCO78835.1 hypothetical protein EV699_1223 [Plasticicumulans lactativorans]